MTEWIFGLLTGLAFCIPTYAVAHHRGWKQGFDDFKYKVMNPVVLELLKKAKANEQSGN